MTNRHVTILTRRVVGAILLPQRVRQHELLSAVILRRAELTATLVLEAIRRQVQASAYGDLRRLFDRRGNHKRIHQLSQADADLLGGYEIVLKNAKAGDGHIDEVLKVKLKDHAKFVEMGAKYFGPLQERVEMSGDDELIALLQSARVRGKQADE